jgi:hypothetical protein
VTFSACWGGAVRHVDVAAIHQTAMSVQAAAAALSTSAFFGCFCHRGDAVRHLDVFATFQNAISTLAAAAASATGLLFETHCYFVSCSCRGDAVRHLDVFATFQNAMSMLAAAAGGEQGLMSLLQAGAGNSPSPAMQVCKLAVGNLLCLLLACFYCCLLFDVYWHAHSCLAVAPAAAAAGWRCCR